MKDSYNREIDYVRLSITDRCDLRCTYCMPATGNCFMEKEKLLSKEDMIFLIEQLAKEGIKKVKITGGEPLMNREVISLITTIKKIPGIQKVTLTTNGMLLGKYSQELKESGLDGLNVSLDTLDPDKYHLITRKGKIARVLSGIEKAVAIGLPNIKINTVAQKSLSVQEMWDLASLSNHLNLHVRFIELMPIGMGKESDGRSQEEVINLLEQKFGTLTPYNERLGNGPAKYYSLPGFKGKIGFISAIGHCFCEECDRIRITSDGVLKTCLHMDDGSDLKEAIQTRNSELLLKKIYQAVAEKPEKHQFLEQVGDCRLMSKIGG